MRRFIDGLEERTGIRAAWRHFADEPIQGGARFAYVFGSLLVGLLAMQFLSGLVLSADYAPSVASAHASVARLMDPDLSPLGWLVRAIHHHGASFLVVVLVAHLVQVAVHGAYRKPREINWITGLLLGLLIFGFAFTGYLLPWDETAYYATRVGLNIMASMPVVGPPMAAILQGGDVMGNLTLTRFYAIHVLVLPATLLGLLAIHLILFRRHGVTPKPGRDEKDLASREPFWPHQAVRDAVAIFVMLAGLVAFAAWQGAPLGAKADPSAPFDARPEWYFLWLFQLLHWFEPPLDWIATMGIPGAMAAFLFLLPWIDRSSDPRPDARKLALGGLGIILISVGSLTYSAIREEPPGGAAADAADEPVAVAAASMAPLEIGMIYGEKCTECHHRTGAPNDPDAPDFRDPEFARMGRANYADLVKAIQEGGEIMPAFAEELTNAQIRALLDQIVLRFHETNPLPAGDASDSPPGGN
jgi:ubiquinol-cytochrome c reductase cytochrome b subunit